MMSKNGLLRQRYTRKPSAHSEDSQIITIHSRIGWDFATISRKMIRDGLVESVVSRVGGGRSELFFD